MLDSKRHWARGISAYQGKTTSQMSLLPGFALKPWEQCVKDGSSSGMQIEMLLMLRGLSMIHSGILKMPGTCMPHQLENAGTVMIEIKDTWYPFAFFSV